MKYLLLLLLITTAFAEDFCSGKTDEFDVQVLDANLRPIQNVDVTITYDTGTSFGQQYFTTKVRQTDERGMVHFKIINQGTTIRDIDCTITIFAKLNEVNETEKVEANQHGSIVSVVLENVFPVNFYVKDQFGLGIPNASVTISNRFQKTNNNGFTRIYLPEGEYDYLASYERAKQSGVIVVDDDINFIVTFPFEQLTVNVIDDFGGPLQAKLTIFDETHEMMGSYTTEKTYGLVVPFEVSYKNEIKTGEIDTQENTSALVIYDIHPPTFGEIIPETVNNRTKLTIPVTDPGEFGSGVDIKSLQVSYRVEPSDATTPFSPATVYTVGFNTFSAEFPELPQNSIVSFRADVKDKVGNRATIEGKFSTLDVEVPDDQNQTNTQENTGSDQGLPLFYIVGGIFVVILAIYLVIRIKSKA